MKNKSKRTSPLKSYKGRLVMKTIKATENKRKNKMNIQKKLEQRIQLIKLNYKIIATNKFE